MKRTLLLLVILIAVNVCRAQVVFKDGDTYVKKIQVRSNTVLQQGKRSISINTSSSVTRSYVVNEISARNFYSFKVVTDKIADTVKTANKQVSFSSDKSIDTSSFIEKSLSSVKKRIINIIVNKKGALMAVTRNYLKNKNDSLLAFSGLLPDNFIEGNNIDLLLNLPQERSILQGAEWKISTPTIYGTQTVTYTVLSTNAETSTISFKGTDERNYDNKQNALPIKCYFITNISGKMRVNTKSLIIKERYVKSATSGYQSINGVIFAVAKRSSVAERVN